LATPMAWEALVDTARPGGRPADGRIFAPGETYRVRGRSFALFVNRAPRLELPVLAADETAVEPAPEFAEVMLQHGREIAAPSTWRPVIPRQGRDDEASL
jgi:hypothetical protein